MTPGNRFDGFIESRLAPDNALTVDVLGIYRRSDQFYDLTWGFAGLDCRWKLLRWGGIGGGAEWTSSNAVVSWAPQVYFFVAPVTEPTQLSVGLERSWTGQSSPLYQVTGNICVSL